MSSRTFLRVPLFQPKGASAIRHKEVLVALDHVVSILPGPAEGGCLLTTSIDTGDSYLHVQGTLGEWAARLSAIQEVSCLAFPEPATSPAPASPPGRTGPATTPPP